jgi:arginyl-tRNA synthetase
LTVKFKEFENKLVNTEKSDQGPSSKGDPKELDEKLKVRCKNYVERIESLELQLATVSSEFEQYILSSTKDDQRDLKFEFCKFREETELFNSEREEKIDILMKDIDSL